MESEVDRESIRLLHDLASGMEKLIENGLSNGSFEPDKQVYIKSKVANFKYDSNGPGGFSTSTEDLIQDSWFWPGQKIGKIIEQIPEYKVCLEHLERNYGESSSQGLHRFRADLMFACLERKIDSTLRDIMSNNLIKSLTGQPLTYGAKVQLEGIIVEPERIEVMHGISIRRTAKEDLEFERPYYSFPRFDRSFYGRTPSAILEIEFPGHGAREIQERVEKATTILRLFKVGGVRHLSYNMFSESLTDLNAGGTMFSGDNESAREKYLLTADDVKNLKRFWSEIQDIIPRDLFWRSPGQEDHLTIAYGHYSRALLQGSGIEERVASAVMGLESLFLKAGGEQQELTYRLGNRVAKLAGNLGHAPLHVRDSITDAYSLRSLFAHGGHLSHKKKMKLEKRMSVHSLLLESCEYLRLGIICYMMLHIEKDALIDLIDEAFLTKTSGDKLSGMLNTTRHALGISD